jgi:hypothetical protein
MRLARASLIASMLATLALSALAAPAAADAPVPPAGLARLINPKPLDPVIGLLPSRPAPYVPYTGTICADGSPSCIDATIADMQQRLNVLAAACDHDAVFSLAYLRVTENVRDAVNTGVFDDRVWLRQVDAVFAQDYFDTLDAWNSGDPAARATVPEAWRIALKASDDQSVTGLGDFMLNMNAHINRDFSYVLAEVGLTGPDGVSHKKDHNAYNRRLDSLYVPVFKEETARFDPHFDDIDVLTVDETAAGAIMRGWREMVWRNAEKLALAKTPRAKAQAEHAIEGYAASQARVIKRLFWAGPTMKNTRNAWCATHHG